MILIGTLLGMVIGLVILATVLKFNPFLAFLLVSISGGFLLGIPLPNIMKSIQKGMGDMFGSILLVIVLGAMQGKLIAQSGAAGVIADTLVRAFGKNNIQIGLMITGFIIGIPLFYNVGFVLCIPIIFTLVYQYKLPAVYIGLPMMAALSVAHGFLPPHPSPVALVAIFHADMGKTLFLGLVLSIPALILAGPVFSKTLKGITPMEGNPIFYTPNPTHQPLPGIGISFFSALLPVFLLGLTQLFTWLMPQSIRLSPFVQFISDPGIIMLLALFIGSWALGDIRAKGIKPLMVTYENSVKDIAMILLIIGGSGALKQVLVDSGASQEISGLFAHSTINPLLLGWIIAATIRVCLGSATIAGLTTAGIILPLITRQPVNPNLMVLAIGSGSLMFSHVNDPGFWMFKEYFHISLKDTFRSWSLMETIVSLVGIIGVLILKNWV